MDSKLVWIVGDQMIVRVEINKLLDAGYHLANTGWRSTGDKKGITLHFVKTEAAQ